MPHPAREVKRMCEPVVDDNQLSWSHIAVPSLQFSTRTGRLAHELLNIVSSNGISS
jgi:hypothetical protein